MLREMVKSAIFVHNGNGDVERSLSLNKHLVTDEWAWSLDEKLWDYV